MQEVSANDPALRLVDSEDPSRTPRRRPRELARALLHPTRESRLAAWALTAFCAWSLVAMVFLPEVDEWAHHFYLQQGPDSILWFAHNVLDKIGGQKVAMPAVMIGGVVLSAWRWSWRPLVLAMAAQGWFTLTGVLKALFARDAAVLGGSADFWGGGPQVLGEYGMAYPSGHATEVVVLYGILAFLVVRYGLGRDRFPRWTKLVWLVLVLNTVSVSYLLGYHWVSDLVGGLLWGLVGFWLIRHADARLFRPVQEKPPFPRTPLLR